MPLTEHAYAAHTMERAPGRNPSGRAVSRRPVCGSGFPQVFERELEC
jgi:hypothetical protein